MASEFEAIIAGSGLGCLCAPAQPLAAGQRIVLLEKSPHPGGRCPHRDRGGLLQPRRS